MDDSSIAQEHSQRVFACPKCDSTGFNATYKVEMKVDEFGVYDEASAWDFAMLEGEGMSCWDCGYEGEVSEFEAAAR